MDNALIHYLFALMLAFAPSWQNPTGPTAAIISKAISGPVTKLPALVQYQQTLGTSNTLAYGVNVTSGNILIAYMWYGGGSALSLTATDSLSSSYSTLSSASLTTDGDTMAVACASAASSGADTVTFKSAGSAVAMGAVIEEWAGLTCTQDVTAVTNHTAATGSTCGGASPPSITPVTNNDLVLQVCGITSNLSFTPTTGWFRNIGDFDVGGDGLIHKSSQTLYTAGTVTAGDTWTGGNKENVLILIALKAASGSNPTTPSVDNSCTSGTISLSTTQQCTFTVSGSATRLLVQAYMDTNSATVTEVCAFPSANTYSSTCAGTTGGVLGYLLGRNTENSPQQNRTESWTLYAPPTGSIKVQVTWATGDLTSFGAVSLLGGQGAFNLSGASGATTSPSSASITSATNHLVLDQLMVGQVSTCSGSPAAGGSQTQLYNVCNGSGNWYYVSSTIPGASSITTTWTTTNPDGWAMGEVDAY